MKAIFIDFYGTLITAHGKSMEDIEKHIAVLADICHSCDCDYKVVIEAAAKTIINTKTLKSRSPFIQSILDLFKKYNIEHIDKTPCVSKKLSSCSYVDMWKEDEILLYLKRHSEIEEYCIFDDDDGHYRGVSDLDKVRDHLIKMDYVSDDQEEGLCPKHKEEALKILNLGSQRIKLHL